MDIQLKRGLIEICVLKVLTAGDSYGYQPVSYTHLDVYKRQFQNESIKTDIA